MKREYILSLVLLILFIATGILIWQNIQLMNSMERLLHRPQLSREGRIIDAYIQNQARNTITRHAREIQECYNAFLENKLMNTDGTVTIDWRVDTKGKVIMPGVVSSELNSSGLMKCMVEKVKHWEFPPPEVEKYVTHRFKFQKK